MKKILYFLIILSFFISCKKTEQEENIALQKIAEIEQLITENRNEEALALIDSMHVWYKQDATIRRKSDTLRWGIELKLGKEKLPLLDSALVEIQSKFPELTKSFNFVKNEEYQTYGSFEHRQMQTEGNTGRCYLKPSVDEQGRMTITSYYLGAKADHNIIRITVDSLFIETAIAPESNISRFVDIDTYREIIVFDNTLLNEIDKFIANNSDKRIKISLIGEGQPYHYYLTQTERNILAQSYELASALSKFTELNAEQLKLSQKIELLKMRLNEK